jgi:hypothetical protein
MVAAWVPGKLIDKDVIEFERKRILWNGKKYPHVLIFSKDYELKWALDGNPAEALDTQGYVYPWTRSRFLQCDPRNARVRVNVPIEADDLIFGFYFYEELDLIYTKLDVNPSSGVHRYAPPVASSIQDDPPARCAGRAANRDTAPSRSVIRAREPAGSVPVRLRRAGQASRMSSADRGRRGSFQVRAHTI